MWPSLVQQAGRAGFSLGKVEDTLASRTEPLHVLRTAHSTTSREAEGLSYAFSHKGIPLQPPGGSGEDPGVRGGRLDLASCVRLLDNWLP